MNYQDTVNWMFSQLPMYQNQGQTAYKADLTNSIELAGYLGNPENNFKSIHIGGTNGKGSTAHLLASVLGEAGLKVGLYTSPHLVDFRERIRIDGIPVSKQFVIGFIRSHKAYFETRSLSFFLPIMNFLPSSSMVFFVTSWPCENTERTAVGQLARGSLAGLLEERLTEDVFTD